MAMAWKGIGILVGVVVALLGAGMVAGVLPSERVACPPGVTGCTGEYVVSAFAVTSSGLAATLRDGSCVVDNGARACSLVTSIAVGWGDGAVANGSVGVTLTHTYSTAGTYRVTETAYAKASNSTISGLSSQSLTVSESGNGSGGAAYTLRPLLAVTQVGPAVTVRDTSTVANVSAYLDTLQWGQAGAEQRLNATGDTASFTYELPTNSTGGTTFTITQTDTGTSPSGGSIEASANYAVTVYASGSGTNSTTTSPPPPPPASSVSPYSFNALSLGLLVGGVLIAVVSAMPGDPRMRVTLLVAGVLVAVGAGYGIGGV